MGLIGLAGLLLAAIAILIFSVAFMSRESRRTAAVNRDHNQPISNGYAAVAIVVVVVVLAITFFLGLLPPLLRRG